MFVWYTRSTAIKETVIAGQSDLCEYVMTHLPDFQYFDLPSVFIIAKEEAAADV